MAIEVRCIEHLSVEQRQSFAFVVWSFDGEKFNLSI